MSGAPLRRREAWPAPGPAAGALPIARLPTRRRVAVQPARDRWVEPLAVGVLLVTLLYVLLSTSDNLTTTSALVTDQVNPWNRWVWLGLLALSLPMLRLRWREVAALARGNWPLLALLLYFALSVGWALDPSASLRRVFLTLVQVLLLATLVSSIRRAPLVHGVIVAAFAAAACADIVYWLINPAAAVAPDGFQGLQGQKNQAGLMLMVGCLAGAPCLPLLSRGVWRWVLAGSVLMMAGLLVVTRSETSISVTLMAALGMPVLLAILRLPERARWAIAAASVALLATALFGYVAWCAIAADDPLRPLQGVTFSARTDIWSFLLDEIAKRPVFGAGYESLWGINPAIQPSLKTDQWFGTYVIITEGHDGYLDLLATGGVVGLAGGLAVLLRTIRLAAKAVNHAAPALTAWRAGALARPTAIFYLALLLGLAVHNFTESNFFSNNGPLAVAFLLAMLDLEKWRIASSRATGG